MTPMVMMLLPLVVISPSCGCSSGEEVRLVTRRSDRYFVCDPEVGIADSNPPKCGVAAGRPGNPRLVGPATRQLESLVEDRSTAHVRLTLECDRLVRADRR